jgi:hypothetical protein
MLLAEGGGAADNLLPRLQQKNPKRKLERVKIPKGQLRLVWRDVIEPMLKSLLKAGVIDSSYKTTFELGSTKLAHAYLNNVQDDKINRALDKKQFFGDLDVDVSVKDGFKAIDAANVLVKENPERFAAKDNGAEANLAVVVDGIQMPNGDFIPAGVIQVDLVNMKGKEDSTKFLQSSHEDDISTGVKGVFHKFIIRALLRKVDAPNVNAQTPEAKSEIAKWSSQGYNIEGEPRYSLKGDGLSIVIDMEKPGVKERKNITLQRAPVADYSPSGLDKMSKILFGKDSKASDIQSSNALVTSIMNSANTKNKSAQIWKEFVKMSADFKDKIDSKDYDTGMKHIAKLFGQKYPIEENSMDNMRESIRRNLFEDDQSIIEEIIQSLGNSEAPTTVSGDTPAPEKPPMSEEEARKLKEAYMAGFMSSNESFNGKNARRVYRNSALKPESIIWNKNHQKGFENFVRKLG